MDDKIIEKIQSFSELKDNWDDNGARATELKCIEAACAFLLNHELSNEAFAYPTTNGGVGLEWEATPSVDLIFRPVDLTFDPGKLPEIYIGR